MTPYCVSFTQLLLSLSGSTAQRLVLIAGCFDAKISLQYLFNVFTRLVR